MHRLPSGADGACSFSRRRSPLALLAMKKIWPFSGAACSDTAGG
jgi:hypothetical protein